MNVIGITGYKRSGKDSVAGFLARHGYERRAFADKLKQMALAIDPYVAVKPNYELLSGVVDAIGWEAAKAIPDVRRLLQRIGTEGVRDTLGEETWVNALFRDIQHTNGKYVITDVRFPNEADAIVQAGGLVIRVTRPGTSSDGHASEAGVDLIHPDMELQNDGSLEDLERAVDWLAKLLKAAEVPPEVPPETA